MQSFLERLLPRVLPKDVSFLTVAHEGKTDLQNSIRRKLRAWNVPGDVFIIIQDQDSNNCKELKHRLVELCEESNINNQVYMVRIACHELESWYLGDFNALSDAYRKNFSSISSKRKYQNPDNIASPKEELRKIIPEYQQIDGANRIGSIIDFNNNKSVSFGFLISGIEKLLRDMRKTN